MYLYFQNAGAIIGKGGTNIKRLRADVSIILTSVHIYDKFKRSHTSPEAMF